MNEPISENILFAGVMESGVGFVDDLSDGFVDNISDSSIDSDNDSNGILPGFDDDTDIDPDYEQLSEESNSDEDQSASRRAGYRPKPTGRPKFVDPGPSC